MITVKQMDKWEALESTLEKEAEGRNREAGGTIVEVRRLPEGHMMLIHKKTFKRLSLTYLRGPDSLRIEDAAGNTSIEKLPEFLPTFAADLIQRLS
jgi:hypothetical protein